MKKKLFALTVIITLNFVLVGCGGGTDSSNDALSTQLQVASGDSVQITLANNENLLLTNDCTYFKIYDNYENETSINNPMIAGEYTLKFYERYAHHNDSKGVYFYLSSGIIPNSLIIGKTYAVADRETQIYKLNISTIKSFSHTSQRMNASIYDSKLNYVGFWNKGQIYTLDTGIYYIVSSPAYCTDGSNSFSINEVKE